LTDSRENSGIDESRNLLGRSSRIERLLSPLHSRSLAILCLTLPRENCLPLARRSSVNVYFTYGAQEEFRLFLAYEQSHAKDERIRKTARFGLSAIRVCRVTLAASGIRSCRAFLSHRSLAKRCIIYVAALASPFLSLSLSLCCTVSNDKNRAADKLATSVRALNSNRVKFYARAVRDFSALNSSSLAATTRLDLASVSKSRISRAFV